MKILIVDDKRFIVESKESPVVGRSYTLEDAATGTGAQNRAFHGLLGALWEWMHNTDTFQIEADGRGYDFTTPDASSFRELFKARYGAGFSHIEYVNDDFGMVRVKTLEEVPSHVIDDFNAGNRGRVKGVLKSWTKYTKKERKSAIDTLLAIIYASGCTSKKVHEIIDGMEE